MDGLRRRLRGGGVGAAAARDAPSPPAAAAKHSTRALTVNERLRAVLQSTGFSGFMLVVTLYSLFGDDVRVSAFERPSDSTFVVLTAVAVAALLVEIVLQCIAVDGYCRPPGLFRLDAWRRASSAADESDHPTSPARDSVVLAAPVLSPVARASPATGAAAPEAAPSPLLRAWRRASAAWRSAVAAARAFRWRRSAALAYHVAGLCAVGSFYFWLDSIALVSMVVELLHHLMDAGLVSPGLVAAVSASQVGINLARAGRAARAGARIGRLLRFLRLLRLLRRAEPAAVATSAVSASSSPRAAASSETRVGAALTELMTRRVVVGVLLMILVVPFLTTALPDDSSALAVRVLAAAVASQAATSVAARHNASTGRPFNASQLAPLDPLDPSGPVLLVLRTLASLRGDLAHAAINGTAVRVQLLGGDGAALGEDPSQAIEAQRRPSELDKLHVTVALYANGSAVAAGTHLYPAPGWPFYGAVAPAGERVSVLTVSLWFNLREDQRMMALLDVGLILLVLLVLGAGAALFSFTINRLVLHPLEQLLAVARYISDHPLDQHAHQRRGAGPSESSDGASLALARRHGERTALAAAAIDAHHQRHSSGGSLGDRDGGAGSGGGASAEVQLLMSTLLNVGSLLRVAFGDAGAGMITANLNAAKELNPVLPGRRTHVALVHVRVRHMALLHAALGDSVLLLLNALAQVVHGVTLAYGGVVVRNACDGWLLGWTLDEPAATLAFAAATDRERGVVVAGDRADGAAASSSPTPGAAPGDDLRHTRSTPGETLWSGTADKALAASLRLLLEVARRSDVLLGTPAAAAPPPTDGAQNSGSGSGRGSGRSSPPAPVLSSASTEAGVGTGDSQRPSPLSAAAASFVSLPTVGSFVARLSRRDDRNDTAVEDATAAAAHVHVQSPTPPANLLCHAARSRLSDLLAHTTSAELLEVSLHAGWCIEGPLGSDKKIDATYMGPHVTAVTALCSDASAGLEGQHADAPAPGVVHHPRVLASHAFVLLLSPAAQCRMRLHSSSAAAPSGGGSGAASPSSPAASALQPSDAQLMAARAVTDRCFEPPEAAQPRTPQPRAEAGGGATSARGCGEHVRSTYDLPSCAALLAGVGETARRARPALATTARHQVQALIHECAASYAHPLRLFSFPVSDRVLRAVARREPLEAPAALVRAALSYALHLRSPSAVSTGSAPPPPRLPPLGGRSGTALPRRSQLKGASLLAVQHLRPHTAGGVGGGSQSAAPEALSSAANPAVFASMRDVRSIGAVGGGSAARATPPPSGDVRPALVVVTVVDTVASGEHATATAAPGESGSDAWDRELSPVGRHSPGGSPSDSDWTPPGGSVASSPPSNAPGDAFAVAPAAAATLAAQPPPEPQTLLVAFGGGPGEVAVAAATASGSAAPSAGAAAVDSFVAAFPRCPAGGACDTTRARCGCCGPLDEADLELLRWL